MKKFLSLALIAVFALCIMPAVSSAGPLRDWVQERQPVRSAVRATFRVATAPARFVFQIVDRHTGQHHGFVVVEAENYQTAAVAATSGCANGQCPVPYNGTLVRPTFRE